MSEAEIPVPRPPESLRGLITPDELRAWRRTDPWRATRDLALIWVQIIGAFALFLVWSNPLTFVVAFVLVAGGQHGLQLAAHEFSHYLVVPGNRKLNDLLGNWLFASPAGLPFLLYRHRHFQHHRLYSTERDTKLMYRADWKGPGLYRQILKGVTGLDYLDHARHVLSGRRQEEEGPSPIAAYGPTLVVQGAIFLVLALIDPWLYFGLWLLPLVTLNYFFNKVRATMEHQPLDRDGGVDPNGLYYKGTPGPFVRSSGASWIERLFLSKINFHYHVEHHLWPQIGYQFLPLAHAKLLRHGGFEEPRLGIEKTYTSTILALWREPRT